jgi:hypothetical protein
MPNRDMPQGFQPKGRVLRLNAYQAGGTIYPGDAVTLSSAGQVTAASASTALVGVAASYATSGEDVLVFDDPNQLFEGQADDATIDAQTDINLNYDLLATAGDSTYKASRHEVDASTQATTATLPLKVIAVQKIPGEGLGAQVKCILKINNHQLDGSTGTAGI